MRVSRSCSLLIVVALSIACDRAAPKPPPAPAVEARAAQPPPPPKAAPQEPVRSAVDPAVAARSADFAVFWTAFRRALLARDQAALASMTQLPIAVRGTLDDDPVRHVPAAQLAQLVDDVLRNPIQTPIQTGSGVSVLEQTQEQYVREHEQPGAKDQQTQDWARVADLEFCRKGERWRWCQTYAE